MLPGVRPVAEFLRRLTFTVLLGDNDAHAKNLAILHLPGHSILAINGSFEHRRISAAHLTREAERWNAFAPGEAEQIVTTTLADFARALDRTVIPPGVPAAATAQLAWNLQRLQAGSEIGERPTGYRRRRHAQAHWGRPRAQATPAKSPLRAPRALPAWQLGHGPTSRPGRKNGTPTRQPQPASCPARHPPHARFGTLSAGGPGRQDPAAVVRAVQARYVAGRAGR